jgi:NhaP-type Na+/H+ or K+/H+ antiporter
MHHVDPALLTIVWATAAGILAQVLAYRLKIPAILPLLAIGLALGPSGLDLVRPATLGTGLSVVVKLCVAIILFDGALNLRLADLKRALAEVRRLVTIGVIVTWVGAALAGLWIARLSLPVAIVFGALLTVTGPTVVQPLLRRVPIGRRVKTILEGEAILIDPVGAVLAVAVVDIVLGIQGVQPIGVLGGAWAYIGRLLVGLVVGWIGAWLLTRLLKARGTVPGELVNLVSLAMVWTAFAVAEWLHGEAGIMAVVTMGLAVQRGEVPEERRLRGFKEQLTVLGIGLLFVLLAASLPISVVREEGWRGFLTVLALILVVRPVSAWVSLRRSTLNWRERAFIAWIAPRGIVAASIASLFAITLTDAGFPEGQRLLALAFLTVALTVTIGGLTAAPLARMLGLQSLAGRRAIVIGAGPLGLGIAELLRRHHRPVALVDRNDALVEHARSLGFEAHAGNALDETVLAEAGAEDAETAVGVTTNSEVNALATHLAHDAFGVARAFPALGHPSRGAGPKLLERVGGYIAFGRPLDVRAWETALERGEARFVSVTVPGTHGSRRAASLPESIVAIARVRGDSVEIVNAELRWEGGDELIVLSALPESETRATLSADPGHALLQD